MTIGQLKKSLEALDDSTPCAYALWLPGDVRDLATERGHGVLTPEQVETVLNDVQHRYDASIGINWDVIAQYLPEIAPDSLYVIVSDDSDVYWSNELGWVGHRNDATRYTLEERKTHSLVATGGHWERLEE